MYSDHDAQEQLKVEIARKDGPIVISDGDGTFLIGMNLPDPTERIPEGVDPFDAGWRQQSGVSQDYFAEEPMNVYLHPDLVEVINAVIRHDPSLFIINTGRSREQLIEILAQSGIEEPEKVWAVTDHGERLTLGGESLMIKPFTPAEAAFLALASDEAEAIAAEIMELVIEEGGPLMAEKGIEVDKLPPVHIERKAFSTTLHVRQMLTALDLGEKDGLGRDVMRLLETRMQALAERSDNPVIEGRASFIAKHEPFSYEIRRDGIDKGLGFERLMEELAARGIEPSGVVFSGDSIACREEGELEGTDANAFCYVKGVGERVLPSHIPGYAIQILHPGEDGGPAEAHRIMPPEHPLHHGKDGTGIDLVLPSPMEYSAFLADALSHRLLAERGTGVTETVARQHGDMAGKLQGNGKAG